MKKHFNAHIRLFGGYIELATYVVMVTLLLTAVMMLLDAIIPTAFDSLYRAILTDDKLEYRRYILLLTILLVAIVALLGVFGWFLMRLTQELQRMIDACLETAPRNQKLAIEKTVEATISPRYAECHDCSLYQVCRLSNSTYAEMLDQAGCTEAIDAFLYNHTHLPEVCRASVAKTHNQATEEGDCVVQVALEYGYQLGQVEGFVEGHQQAAQQVKDSIRAELNNN